MLKRNHSGRGGPDLPRRFSIGYAADPLRVILRLLEEHKPSEQLSIVR
jgi:hypothetical protein